MILNIQSLSQYSYFITKHETTVSISDL